MRLEMEFDYLQCSDSQKVHSATYMLDGEADNWWKGAQDEIRRTKVEVTWDVFVQMFFDRYFSDVAQEKKEFEFMNLRTCLLVVDS